MTLLGVRLAVSIPDTILEDKESLRDKTAKLGSIARAAAIYGVDVVEVYEDRRGVGERSFIRKLLEYLETPQYLRKSLYPIDDELQFAGTLPPLRIPSHKAKVPAEGLSVGDIREGVVGKEGHVDIGMDAAAKLRGDHHAGRVTTRVVSKDPLTVEVISREEVKEYWGYVVKHRSLSEVVGDGKFPFRIGTSRFGRPVSEVAQDFEAGVRRARAVKLVFGSPSRGIFDIFGKELTERLDMVVNLYPEQKVETVRTEEAIFASLGLVSFLISEKA